MEALATQVLVIGGGLAGLCAALEARRAGREVLLVCKSRVGRSGNSILAAGNISACTDPQHDSQATFAADILRGGRDIGAPSLARCLAAESAATIAFLRECGVDFLLTAEQKLLAQANPGHSVARTLAVRAGNFPAHTSGLAFTLPVLQAAQAAGVTLLESCHVVELCMQDERVCGARGYTRGGEEVLIHADAVVLATGGGGRMFAQTNNTGDVTADGLALAYAAGAELRDLEFIQFHPVMGIAPLRIIFPTTLFSDGAVLRNRDGQRFLLAVCPAGEVAATRDTMSRAIDAEVRAGRGVQGGVVLDLSQVSHTTAHTRYKKLWDLFANKGMDLSTQPVIVGNSVHFFMGGVTIDSDGATTRAGLFAAGEVTGGLHGANRLGGNALMEAAVFGRIAGRMAAQSLPVGTRVAVTPRQAVVLRSVSGVTHLKKHIAATLSGCVGVVRSERLLQQGLHTLEELERQFCEVEPVPCGQEWFEVRAMLTIATPMLCAALARTESRGAHFRSDFPQPCDAEWQGSLRVQRGADGMPEIRFVPSSGATAGK